MDVGLHRVEALAGDGRYALTFRAAAGAELSAVAQVTATGLKIAAASLPEGWAPGGEAYELLVEAVHAVDRARHAGAAPAQLLDVPGGWDVMIGNVLLEPGNLVACASHGAMRLVDGVWTCPECGARAVFATN